MKIYVLSILFLIKKIHAKVIKIVKSYVYFISLKILCYILT